MGAQYRPMDSTHSSKTRISSSIDSSVERRTAPADGTILIDTDTVRGFFTLGVLNSLVGTRNQTCDLSLPFFALFFVVVLP